MIIGLISLFILMALLAIIFIKNRNKKVISDVKDIQIFDKTAQHYYMFTLDKYNFLIYVTSIDKMQDDKIQSIKYTIIEKLNITEDVSKEIGVSYLGYISETEFKSKN